MRPPRTSRFARLGILTTGLLGTASYAFAIAQDPFAVALPGKDLRQQGGATASIDAHVNAQDGTAGYSYEIEVPPGRNRMAPHLALSYSSTGALRGGLAVGWSLNIPAIERDTSSPAVAYRYAGEQLILAPGDIGTGTRYRPALDDDMTRIERTTGGWSVYTPDGVIHTYSGAAGTSDGSTRWNLTSERDFFGNTVVYDWNPVVTSNGYVDYYLNSIEYSSNSAQAIAAHARVEFAYYTSSGGSAIELCSGGTIPIGAQTDHHFGLKRMHGARRLTAITTKVKDTPGASWRTSRIYTLGYEQSELACTNDRPPLRYLKTISATAYDANNVATSLPPMTFGYGPYKRSLDTLYTTGTSHLGTRGTNLGPESTLMDLDGDGIADQVRVYTPVPGDQDLHCALFWRKGSFGGTFAATEQRINLPTARWDGPDHYPASGDSCSLNGQRAFRHSMTPVNGGSCGNALAQVTYQFLDWNHDGRVDLGITSWLTGAADLGGDFGELRKDDDPQQGSCPEGQVESGDGCTCPQGQVMESGGGCHSICNNDEDYDPGTGGCLGNTCTSYDECGDNPDPNPPTPQTPPMFSCSVADATFDNQIRLYFGDWLTGGFPLTPSKLVTTPRDVPPGGGEIALPFEGTASLPALVDLDGDGHLDLVKFNGVGSTNPITVWRGTENDTFGTATTWSQIGYYGPGANVVTTIAAGVVQTSTAAVFADMDGDGLLDIVTTVRNAQNQFLLNVSHNLGGQFAAPVPLGPSTAGLMLPPNRARTEMVNGVVPSYPMLSTGWRGNEVQLTDIDNDGLPELVLFGTNGSVGNPASAHVAYRFFGDQMTNFTYPDSTWEPLEQLVRVVNEAAWYRASEFTDVTGDGLPDLVTADQHGQLTVRFDGTGVTPARLLTSIDNGKGGQTQFVYAAATDPAVVTNATRNDPHWVVRTINKLAVGQPTMYTSYRYESPTYGVESSFDHSLPHFLGFAKVTTEQSGQQGFTSSRVVESYSYSGDDARGHVVKEVTSLVSGSTVTPVTVETSHWTTTNMVGGALFTYRDTHTTRTCATGASEAGCSVDFVNVLTERETYAPWLSNGYTILYENTKSTEEQPGMMRATVRDFYERISATEYRVLQTEDERQDANGNLLSRVTTGYDNSGLPMWTQNWTSVFGYALTSRTFDALGNVLTVKRPNQNATNGTKVTTYTYDGHKLNVIKTVNELGHTINETHDVATGIVTRREGPAKQWQCIGITCTLQYRPEVWTIDGFGRVTEHRIPIDTGGGYYLVAAEWTSYHDAAPTTITTQRLREYGGSVKIVTDDEYDGAGRLVKHTDHPDTTTTAVTTYSYDAGGELASVTLPSPQGTGTVTYTYSRDGLGRMTTALRPDGTWQATSYDGLAVQTQDISPQDGAGPLTRTVHDPLGRLVTVNEPDGAGNHVTSYVYSPIDQLLTLTDADGTTTTMGYNLAGHRTSITRGGRIWSYSYDNDGNVTSELAPFASGTPISDVYSSTTYDELDRPRVHTPATRGLSSQRLAQLGIGPVTTTYDGTTTAIGRPTQVTFPVGSMSYGYDARGNLTSESRTTTLSAATHGAALSVSQSVTRAYNLLDAPTTVTWDDGTTWTTSYDARGLVAGVTWLDPMMNAQRTLAAYTRGPTGLPTARVNAFSQQREWTYDVLGRVVHDRVYPTGGSTSWIDRSYGLDGFGRLSATWGTVGTADNVQADFTYDGRGRLAAASGPAAYHADLGYSPAGNITRATVTGALDAPARDVRYSYGAVDPQAVDQLSDATTGAAVARVGYDLSGNAVSREVNGQQWTITPDGDDQIREVAGPGGTEQYLFGPRGERVAAIGPDGVKLWFAESETHYTTAGAPIVRWHHIAAGEPLARVENKTSLELQYADALQNLAITLTPAGEITGSFLYGGFGELVAATGDANHRRLFNGKEDDAVSGLRHYGYRSYDPVLLRWTAADPLYRVAPEEGGAEPQRANLYAFELNDPLRYFDPDGRDSHRKKHKPTKKEVKKFCSSDGVHCGKHKKEKPFAKGKTIGDSYQKTMGVYIEIDAGEDQGVKYGDHVYVLQSDGTWKQGQNGGVGIADVADTTTVFVVTPDAIPAGTNVMVCHSSCLDPQPATSTGLVFPQVEKVDNKLGVMWVKGGTQTGLNLQNAGVIYDSGVGNKLFTTKYVTSGTYDSAIDLHDKQGYRTWMSAKAAIPIGLSMP